MPPKMLTSTALTRDSDKQDAKSLEYLIFVGTAANVEKVGRLAAVVLDQVHRAHRQPGAVDETGDITVQVDVGKAALAGPQLGRVFLGGVQRARRCLRGETERCRRN